MSLFVPFLLAIVLSVLRFRFLITNWVSTNFCCSRHETITHAELLIAVYINQKSTSLFVRHGISKIINFFPHTRADKLMQTRVRVMVFSATFNNISAISWKSVPLVEKTGVNHRPAASDWQILSHKVVSSTPRHERNSNSQL